MAVYMCPECAYAFDEDKGDDREGYAAGTLFAELPDEFVCPDCSVRDKSDFELQTE